MKLLATYNCCPVAVAVKVPIDIFRPWHILRNCNISEPTFVMLYQNNSLCWFFFSLNASFIFVANFPERTYLRYTLSCHERHLKWKQSQRDWGELPRQNQLIYRHREEGWYQRGVRVKRVKFWENARAYFPRGQGKLSEVPLKLDSTNFYQVCSWM